MTKRMEQWIHAHARENTRRSHNTTKMLFRAVTVLVLVAMLLATTVTSQGNTTATSVTASQTTEAWTTDVRNTTGKNTTSGSTTHTTAASVRCTPGFVAMALALSSALLNLF
ncbi:hypothetical protein MATL_G00115010 [Megalops atlanticus]|uniref:Uncharacterized protein n=1 Tax=Megalops atlanticus TaxID=7932 RepID=A0A9D3Q1V9_MEGAT|nr:hypothetical protein MATL_G00115010 [Megalops atlanticus]